MKIIYFTENLTVNKYKRLSQYVTCYHNWQQLAGHKGAAKSGGGQSGLKSGGGQQW